MEDTVEQQKPTIDKRTEFIITSQNQSSLEKLSIEQAVLHYEKKHYGSTKVNRHAIAHFIEAGLARPDKLMNYPLAEHEKPLYQASFQAELLADFSNTLLFAPKVTVNSDLISYANDLIEDSLFIQNNDILSIAVKENNYSKGGASHNKHAMHYINYLYKEGILEKDSSCPSGFKLDKDRLWKPSPEEVAFHIEKILELRELVKKRCGKYLHEMKGEEIRALPLSTIMIDNTSPWDISEKEKRAQLRKEFYGANTAGHALINSEPSTRQK